MVRIEISDKIIIEQKYDMSEWSSIPVPFNNPDPDLIVARMFGYNPTRIYVKDKWYDVIPLYALARTKSEDGYYRFIYIQINLTTSEYYIGKVNRKKWKEIMRYQGSGLLFQNKYSKHKEHFVRYYIAYCSTQEETERLEASIVDKELLKDEKCLNLVQGGGGTTNHNSEDRNEKISKYMKEHPENYRAMIDAAKQLYCSGNTVQLEQRGKKIKSTMSSEKYSEMFRDRIKKWKEENPEKYAEARDKNRQSLQSEESKKKRNASLEKWRSEHPKEYEDFKRKSLAARTSPEANKKRANTIREFNKNNPDKAKENQRRRSEASLRACQKGVNMLNLETGEIERSFDSQHEAARWLVENGYAKNTNCVSSISSVCLKKPCTTGYGYRKKAYGFGWEFKKEE